jgi:spore coat protein U-like protein
MKRAAHAVWFACLLAAAQSQAADCTLGITGLAFGGYDPLAASALDSTATVTVTCGKTVAVSEGVNYTLTASTGAGGSYVNRAMFQASERLAYNLYRNSARTTIWGNGSGGSSTMTGSFNLSIGTPTRLRNHIVYGRIPPSQNAASGSYSDTLVVTLTF